jgi:hypothetical protein
MLELAAGIGLMAAAWMHLRDWRLQISALDGEQSL